ncbi:uncharacterized protein LOC135373952 isoform X1 [Ornithodoros turicata]|uniref:uncharacterized protein LOC135373952 isoform X1 n=1 Tax=Ornithodoros turicata TaxID=34597 RepID=UPI00313A25B2
MSLFQFCTKDHASITDISETSSAVPISDDAYDTDAHSQHKKRRVSGGHAASSSREGDSHKATSRLFRKLLHQMEALSDDTKELKRETGHIRSMLQDHFTTTDLTVPDSFNILPITDERGLRAVEASINDETNFKAFVSQLWTSGGASSAECTRNVLRRLVTMNFAAEICYSGHNADKRVFQGLALSRLLTACVRRAFPSATDKEIASAARNYFRCAPGVVRKRRSNSDGATD